jgi:hypothetical protein
MNDDIVKLTGGIVGRQLYFSDIGLDLLDSRSRSDLWEQASRNGGEVCADSVDVFDSFCVMCSRGVAGGDGRSISK